MKRRICLHALDAAKNKKCLTAAVQKHLPPAAVKCKIKEKSLPDNAFFKAKFTRISPKSLPGLQAVCCEGVMVASDRLYHIRDVVIEYDAGCIAKARELVSVLLSGKTRFVLEEPNLKRRLEQLCGSFKVEKLAEYDPQSAATALLCHLPWHIYGVSKAWGELSMRPGDKQPVRQLRVKLRRLRSAATFFKPLLYGEKMRAWQDVFKSWTDRLSAAREFDVALLTCQKIRLSAFNAAADELELEAILLKKRRHAAAGFYSGLKLNEITLALADFLLYLQNAPLAEAYCGVNLREYIRLRLAAWCGKLAAKCTRDLRAENMQFLHGVRIKVKRLRYLLQGVPEANVTMALLKCMKNLQDLLGALHDSYVNVCLAENILRQHSGSQRLNVESAMFCGWERARTEAALERLPACQEAFCKTLAQWQEENL